MPFDLGDLVPLTVTIKDANGDAVNATTVTLTISLPDGSTVTPAVPTPATPGVYAYDYPTVQPGRHVARWTSTGPQAAYVDTFDVRASSPAYVASLADLRRQLNMTATGDDEELRYYLEAATGVVERHLRRAVVRRTFVEQITANGYLALSWTPVVSLTSVVFTDGSTTVALSDLLVSAAGIVTSKTAPSVLAGDITATYVAGMTVIPAEFSLAGLIIAQHLWETQLGAKGSAHPAGLENPGLGFTSFGFAIPNRALELLGSPVPGIA